MNTALNLPLWQSPPNSPPDSSEDLDLIVGSFNKSDLYDISGIPLDMPGRRSSSSSGSECDSAGKFACRLNNNASDSGECDVEKCHSASGECGAAVAKRKLSRSMLRDGKIATVNVSCGTSSECDAGAAGGDDDDEEEEEEDGDDEEEEGQRECERPLRPRRELNSSNEINKRDVTPSRGVTSNPGDEGKIGSCGERESRRKGSCSAGSYSRRKHHKHHKHKRRSAEEERTPVSPKVNPIFLWVRQDDTRIVEVMCEDYDHRNRIRLTKTHLGWRAIPKTERFAAAIIPKAPPATDRATTPEVKRKHRKKSKMRKSKKKRLPSSPPSPIRIKECSVTLSRDEVENAQKMQTMQSRNHSRSNSGSRTAPASRSPSRESPRPSRSSSRAEGACSRSSSTGDDPPHDTPPPTSSSFRLIKSFSCEFPDRTPERIGNLVRSSSFDQNLKTETNFLVQKKVDDNDADEHPGVTEDSTKEENLPEKTEEVIDIVKHDFNDADCDELGQLLKDIPDLEFNEQELEEMNEDEEWSTPTDLTVPKTKSEENECPKGKLPVLPPSISSLVTVTSSMKPAEPLAAPLPEVTITPIPNPKPAHQQKPQNNFLESLLSEPVKPEKDDPSRMPDKRTAEKRKLQTEIEARNKKLKVEDITLKSLLSKQSKGLELESYVKKMKSSKQENDSADISKSRLHELLTEGVTSNSSDPIVQLKQVLSNPELAVPDPLLVPRARLPALVASPASEIPRLLTMHLEKKIEETPCPPKTDSDMLEVSLSNLRSLLSCNPDKTKSTDAEDLASYQKSLEAFLEWQRYQTELMKKSSLTSGMSPADIDLATATALNQMLWLPYLELNCNSNPMPSLFPHNYPGNLTAPPHISTNHFAQSSPFLTPTSPMDIDAQMKTLAMWQETVMSQQNAHQSRKVPSTLLQQEGRGLKAPTAQKKQHPSPIPSPQKMRNYPQYSPRPDAQKNHFNFDNYHLHLQQQQQQALMRQQYELQRKQQKREMHKEHQRQQPQPRPRQDPGQYNYDPEADKRNRISVRPLSNLMDKTGRKKQSWQQFEQDLRKSAEMTNQMALRWHQFEEEMRRNQMQITKSKMMRREAQWTGRDGKPSETAKLKVKNLVDPNMSPPKLLKQISPEVLPVPSDEAVPSQDESQGHLWHPLFGSNQIKNQSYNSPWRWTTVTVNGE